MTSPLLPSQRTEVETIRGSTREAKAHAEAQITVAGAGDADMNGTYITSVPCRFFGGKAKYCESPPGNDVLHR